MSQTIIQLSEKNSITNQNSLTPNGDFEVTLKDKVEIREGDRVDLKSVFVDSVSASQGKITVDEDVSGFVEVVPYIYNWNSTDKDYNENGVGDVDTLQSQPDGKVYFAATKVTPKSVQYRRYEVICIASAKGGYMRPCQIKIQYTRNDGSLDTFTIPIRGGDQQLYVVSEEGGLATEMSAPQCLVNYKSTDGGQDPAKSMKLLSPSADDLVNKYNVSAGFMGIGKTQNGSKYAQEGFSNDTGLPVNNVGTSRLVTGIGGGVIHPRKRKQTFTVNKGEYYMSELCQIISDQITTNGTLTDRPMNNALLTSDLQIKKEESIGAGNTTDFIYYVAEDGSNVFKYANNITNDYFVGSDQFGLLADDATQKAKFVALHSSLYDNNGSVVVKYLKDGTRTNANYFQANKNGGVVITDLEPFDFWNKLGFSQTDSETHKSIIARPIDNVIITTGGIADFGVFKIDATEGIYTTGATKGVADSVVKVDGTTAVFDKVQSVNNLNVATTTTTQIFAQVGQSEAVQRDGYFKIRVDLGIQNDLVSDKQIENNIQGVISKYFSTNSYTSDMGSGSISYIHRGQHTYISRVRVRILDGNDEIDGNIGDDNTVFLAITRASPQ